MQRTPGTPAGSGDDAVARQAAADAAAQASNAQAMAANVRQMILNRDTSAAAVASDVAALKTNQTDLATLASNYEAALASSVADRAAIHAALDALTLLVNALPTIRTGTAQVTAALLAGASKDVVVTLNAAMPNATYSAGAWINGGTSLLGQTQLVGITGQTQTTVTVQVKNVGLASIAASALSVQVLAVK